MRKGVCQLAYLGARSPHSGGTCHAFIPIRGRQPGAGLNFSSERQGVPFWDKPDSGYGMSPFLINL